MKFNTVKECEDAINAILAIGQHPDPDWYAQLAALKTSSSPSNAGCPVYSHLKSKTDRHGNPWYSTDLQKCIESTVDKLMTPSAGFKQQDPGLLLGKIQSGKTRAFVGIIGLMFDKGADIAIVLTKGTKALAQQTKTRMEEEFTAFASRRILGQAVVEVSDILSRRNGFTVRELGNKNIIVCKKEKIIWPY